MLTNEKFFDTISDSYDNMIIYKKAVERKKAFLEEFSTIENKNAADLGCGTGVDSIALSKLGYNVTGFDISSGMIKKAKQNAQNEKVKIDFLNKSITDISYEHYKKYDFIISLGNAFANLNLNELETSIGIIKNMLNQGGRVLIQILNYIPVIDRRERIVNITKDEDFHYIRFYDFSDKWLQFNILQYSIDNPKDYNIISTKIYPHDFLVLSKIFEKSGFTKINMFGGLDRSEFIKDTSKDLVFLAEK